MAQLTTTRLDEWAAGKEPLLQRPTPPEAAWRLAAAVFASTGGQRPASVQGFDLTLQCQGQTRTQRAPVAGVQVHAFDDHRLHCSIDGVLQCLPAVREGTQLHLAWQSAVFVFVEASPYPATENTTDPRRARAPVAGVVAQVAVAVGDVVAAGQPLLCVEAMKMEMWLHAGAAGTVRAVHAKTKDAVAAGAVLVELETTS